MLYYVMINKTVIFKGNFYQCLEYKESLHIGADKCKITSRK